MNRRDIELLSTYLDGELKPSESTKLEARLKTDPELASALNDLRATRSLLRKLPTRKAPRNFTLTRRMVGQNPPMPRTYPIFRLTTAVATLLFFFTIGINSFGAQMASQEVAYGIGGGGGGGDAESFTFEAPAMEEPAAPEPAEPELYADSAPATEEPSVAMAPAQPTETQSVDDLNRVIETPSSDVVEGERVQAEKDLQSPAPLIPPAWQVGLLVIALAGVLLMVLMRQLSARRWK